MSEEILDQLRIKINKIDAQILFLLADRMECSVAVAKAKKGTTKKVFDPEREELLFQDLLDQAAKLNIPPELVRRIWGNIILASRRRQRHV